MKKPTIYVETSVISALWYDGADVSLVFRRLRTRERWDRERRRFALWASTAVEAELKSGQFSHQSECVKSVRRLNYLAPAAPIRRFAAELLRRRLVPETKPTDAAHLAFAAFHAMDYLLTWNYAHMANPIVQVKLNEIGVSMNLGVPLLVSPETIPQQHLGQSIRRRR